MSGNKIYDSLNDNFLPNLRHRVPKAKSSYHSSLLRPKKRMGRD